MRTERCVLAADDDPNDIFLLQRAFRDAEIVTPLHCVHDGQEAIDYLRGEGTYANRDRFPVPSLLILDLKMPRKTGMDVLQWLQEQKELSLLPVMVFSSSAQPGDIEKAYQTGANAFVVKPPSIVQRAELARTIKGFWLTFNEPPPPSRK